MHLFTGRRKVPLSGQAGPWVSVCRWVEALLPATSAATAFLLVVIPPAWAVITFDLLHDTPETREMLKGELGMAAQPAGDGKGADRKAETADELESIWFAREKFLQIGEKEKAQAQLDLLWAREMELGIRNLPEYGEVLVREARREMQRGRLDQADKVLSIAHRLAPEFLPVYFARASLVMKESMFAFLEAGSELTKGAKAVERSFRTQSWAVANLFFTVSAGLSLFFILSIGVMALRHARQASHDIAEELPRRFSPWARTVMGWLILLTPVLVGFPAWSWFAIGGLLLLPYVERSARFIIGAGVLFLLTVPLQVELASSLLSMHRQPLLESIVSVREDHWDGRDYAALKELSREEGTAPIALSAFGIAAKRMGRFEEAEEAFQAALAMTPDDPALPNNLGNIALIDKRVEDAMGYYRRSIEMNPDLFVPHYNLSLAYRENFNFPEGEGESKKAADLDPEANAYHTVILDEHFNRFAVDEVPPVRGLWTLALEENKWQQATMEHLWRALLLVVPRQIWFFAVGALVLFAGAAWAYRASRGRASSCPKCGRPFCSRCTAAKGGDTCSQCHHILVRKEGVDAKVRVGKLAEIKRFQQMRALRRLVLAVLFPGGGQLSDGRNIAGALFLLPASMFLARIFLVRHSFPGVWHLRLTSGWALGAAVIVGYVLWWALSLWLALRAEE